MRDDDNRKVAGRGFVFAFWLIVVALVVLIALISCAPETGNVYGKRYHPSYVYATNQCLSYSKSGVCLVNLPTFHTMPESFDLCLDDGKDRGCRTVPKSTYDEYEIGDWYGG